MPKTELQEDFRAQVNDSTMPAQISVLLATILIILGLSKKRRF